MNLKDWFSLDRGGPPPSVRIRGITVSPGSRVHLRPRAGGNISDKLLEGKTAEIEAIEKDFDGRIHIAVIVGENPGCDVGDLRQHDERFFFSPEEVEPIAVKSDPATSTEFSSRASAIFFRRG
jgi:hypothetical protein